MPNEYLLDTCAIIELLNGQDKIKLWVQNNSDAILNISGWTIIELLKYKKSKAEMEITLRKITQYKVLWTKPEIADEIPTLLTNQFHTQRNSDGYLSGNAIFDALIYSTAKSYNQKLLTRDKNFHNLKDVETVDLNKIDNGAYR